MAADEASVAELLEKVVDRFNAGRFDEIDPGFLAEDVVVERPGGLGTLQGRQAMLEWLRPDAFERQQVTLHNITEVSPGVLFANQTFRAIGAGSGIEVEQPGFCVWWMVGGQVTRVGFYVEEADARAAIAGSGD